METSSDFDLALSHYHKVCGLEKAMLSLSAPVELNVNHYFADGTYTRELLIPRHTVLTGKPHRRSTVNIVTLGKIRVVTDKGIRDVSQGEIFVSGPLVKKAGFALEDTIFVNVFPWDGPEDIQLVEDEFTLPDYEMLEVIHGGC